MTSTPRLKEADFTPDKRSVFMTTNSDGAIVLDIGGVTEKGRTGRLIKFDGIGAEMWKLICAGKSHSEVVGHILSEYRVDRQTVERDLSALLRDAAALGLKPDALFLTEVEEQTAAEQMPFFPWYAQDGNAQRPKPEKLMVFWAFLGLCVFDFLLSAVSMEVMCKAVGSWPLKQRSSKQDRTALLGKLCTAVDTACVWYRRRALCLQRSAVTACMLRTWGIPADMVLATRIMPAMAHAWVEVSRAVVNDRPTVKRFYQTIARY